jgi:large conductance mechanosensitive channel
LVKAVNRMMPKKEAAPEAPKGPTELEVLLEIRDSLKK